MDHLTKEIVVAASVSTASVCASFFVMTLPVLQWVAAVVAIMSGLVAIAVGVIKIRQWWRMP